MKSFIKYIINVFKSAPFGPPWSTLDELDDDRCYNIIIDKTSSSKQLEEVKDFLVREETKFNNRLSNTKALFEMAEIEYMRALTRESISTAV